MENNQLSSPVSNFPERYVWMKTYGCQMNYHDSERVLSHLKDLNFKFTEDQDQADLILFNTCSIRDLSNQKFYSHLGETKRKKEDKKVIIGAGGCIAQMEGKELLKKYPHLDFAFGTDVIDNINEMVFRALEGERFSLTSWDRSDNYSIETKISQNSPQAFINIIKGCDKFCSYCIVPFTRGREKSRTVEEVYNDISKLVEHSGVKEVTLLGQNVNSYGKDNGETLAQLLYKLEEIDGLELVRYTTSHPYDVSDELIEAHGKCKKLSRHLHLPVQSGSNTVLQRMLREYTIEHYMGLVEKLRKANPDIVLSTDIIAGFPNETQEEHEDTLKLLDMAQYDFIYAYSFSPRKGTKAARMKDSINDDIRGERLREIQAYQLKIQEKIRQSLVNKKFRLLVEGQKTFQGETKWRGRTNCNRIIYFKDELNQTEMVRDLAWNFVDVEVTSATALSCQGKLIDVYGKDIPLTAREKSEVW